MPDVTRSRWTPSKEDVEEQLANGETVEKVIVTHLPAEGIFNDRWAITLSIGWAQTIIAICDYDHHASGVANAVAYSLDCDVEWLA